MGNDARTQPSARWLTVKEAADYTRTDQAWIIDHIKSGALKYVPTARRAALGPKGPKRRIIDKEKLDALMLRLEVDETPEPVKSEASPTSTKPTAHPKSSKGKSFRELLDH